jgi:hypothetical protein
MKTQWTDQRYFSQMKEFSGKNGETLPPPKQADQVTPPESLAFCLLQVL